MEPQIIYSYITVSVEIRPTVHQAVPAQQDIKLSGTARLKGLSRKCAKWCCIIEW